MSNESKYTKKDFASNNEVKWCSGCGDYGILSQTQKVLAEIGKPPHETTFVSGIGCSSRFIYYMNSYGYHTIHGRALAVATGMKTANPKQDIWVTIGDGDCISIGGNHFIHAVRRNLDIVCILMDNRIYGLTKGQFSPTTEVNKKTKTSPYGKVEDPMDPVGLALGSGATFVARGSARNLKQLGDLLHKAHAHKGFSLVHVLTNCVIFNDGAFEDFVGKEKQDNVVNLVDGEPMIFGKDNEKAVITNGFDPQIVNVADVDKSQIIVHDEKSTSPGYANFLGCLDGYNLPMSMGILRQQELPTYEREVERQIEQVTEMKGKGDLQSFLNSGDTWTV